MRHPAADEVTTPESAMLEAVPFGTLRQGWSGWVCVFP